MFLEVDVDARESNFHHGMSVSAMVKPAVAKLFMKAKVAGNRRRREVGDISSYAFSIF